jgi:hypothetical protein
MKKVYDVISVHNEPKAEGLLKRIDGENPLFVCTAAIAAMVKSGGSITRDVLLREFERNYELLARPG